MSDKLRLLDLFCGAGGAAMGYHQAGFEVVGVDDKPQPRFPFEFVQADALEFCRERGQEFDVIHASPPCQGYSRMRHLPWLKGREWPLLIKPLQRLLPTTGSTWIIENVADAPLRGIMLCGLMFGLKVYRHRLFESNLLLFQPEHPRHREVIGRGRRLNDCAQASENGFVSLPSKGTLNRQAGDVGAMTGVGRHNFKTAAAAAAMDIDWMKRDELAQAIPPAYTRYIGEQLMERIQCAA